MAIDIGTPGTSTPSLERALWPLTRGIVLSRTTALPGSPSDGDIYIVPSGAMSNANDVAFREAGAWVYVTPTEGWGCYVLDDQERVQFDGVDWQSLGGTGGVGDVVGPASATDSNLAAFDGTTGKLLKDGGVSISTDGTFASDSDLKVATEKATKTYVDAAVAGGGGFTAASTTEVLTGTDSAKGVTPDALAALWEKGSDVASAGTVSLGEGGFFHITGTTTITDIDWATAKDGRVAFIVFDGILTLMHNSTTLKLPGNANITTAAEDRAIFVQDNSDNVICLAYIRADGKPLIPSVTGTPFELEIAVSDESTAITTGTAKITWYAPMDAATISEVFIGLSNQSSSGSVTADLNKNGSTIFSTNPSIDASEDTSLTGTAAVISTSTWSKGDKMTIDIDAAGTGAKGLKMVIRGTRG